MELKAIDPAQEHTYFQTYDERAYNRNRKWLRFWGIVYGILVIVPTIVFATPFLFHNDPDTTLSRKLFIFVTYGVFYLVFTFYIFAIPIGLCLVGADRKNEEWKKKYEQLLVSQNAISARDMAIAQTRGVSQNEPINLGGGSKKARNRNN